MPTDWTSIIINIITMALGGGVGALFTLKSTKKKADAEAQTAYDKVCADRLDQMREEIDYERQRNIELDRQHKIEIDYERARNKELIQRNDDKERRFGEQTNRLREVQDRELKANERILELTKRIGDLDVELAMVRCEDHDCPFRRPPNSHTPPPPGIDRTEWHKARTKDVETHCSSEASWPKEKNS